MNSYLLTIVLKTGEEKGKNAFLDSLRKQITADEGKIEKEDLWGERALSYPIKRQTKGFYAHFEIQSDPQKIKGIDKNLRLDEDVLRYLLIRK